MRYARKLEIHPNETFFLWGPRQAGKSTLLKTLFPTAPRIDLLLSEEFITYSSTPQRLREVARTLPPGSLLIIDEVQKVPALLDEVHWIIENTTINFGLCGSSARKLRRGHANLLGGRAFRYQLSGFVSAELGKDWDLITMLNRGYLPRAYLSPEADRVLAAYVADYLKEEIASEGLVRNLPAFADFLRVVALTDTELVNFTAIGSECGVSTSAAKGYYEILEDTMLGSFLPAYTARAKRRIKRHPKFYLGDVGVVNSLAKRKSLEPGSELFGKAFENWVHHEISAYLRYKAIDEQLSYWALSSEAEVDFIIGDLQVAIEAKSSTNIDPRKLKGLRKLKEEHKSVARRIVVSLESRRRITDDQIEIIPASEFVQELWSGELVR